MKNLSEEELRKIVRKSLQERYSDDNDLGDFDEAELEGPAKEFAKKDITASGEDFEELGTSKFEKAPKFKEKFKAAINKSDDQEIEHLANVINKKKEHEKSFGVGSMNEIDVNPDSKLNRPKDAEGNPITLGIRVEHIETNTPGRVDKFIIGDSGEMMVRVNWIQDSMSEKTPKDVPANKIVVRDKTKIVREVEIDESNIRSHANGRGQNKKPGNYPKQFKRDALREDYDFSREEVSYQDKKEYEEEMDREVYYVVDNEFNQSHYPDLIGKTFESPPSYAQVKLVKQKDIDGNINENESEDIWDEITPGVKTLTYRDMDILSANNSFFVDDEEFETLDQAKNFIDNYNGPSAEKINLYKHGAMEESNDDTNICDDTNEIAEGDSISLANRHGENEKPDNLQESYGDRYEQVVFLDGQEATHALNILMEDGQDAAMDYLKQWHYPGEHDGSNELGNGSLDKTYKKDGYIMSWSSSLGYIGLVYDTQQGQEAAMDENHSSEADRKIDMSELNFLRNLYKNTPTEKIKKMISDLENKLSGKGFEIDEDSQMKRHLAGQREKEVPLGQHAPHSQAAKNEQHNQMNTPQLALESLSINGKNLSDAEELAHYKEEKKELEKLAVTGENIHWVHNQLRSVNTSIRILEIKLKMEELVIKQRIVRSNEAYDKLQKEYNKLHSALLALQKR
jgi:ribosomal protein S6